MREAPLIREPLDLARWIDHTILAPDATEAQVEPFCREAIARGFCSVCVNPIRTFETAKAMIEAGATRIGASASLAIIGAGR